MLQLADDKFYVGITDDVSKRIMQHVTGRGAEWTKRFPFERLQHAESFQKQSDEGMRKIEDDFTLLSMSKRGIENVRGGSWSNVQLLKSEVDHLKTIVKTPAGQCPICGQKEHGDCAYKVLKTNPSAQNDDSDDETEKVHMRNRDVVGRKIQIPAEACVKREMKCSRCGFPGHNKSKCFAKVAKSGKTLGVNYDLCCRRCGRAYHTESVCRARTHKDGSDLPPKGTTPATAAEVLDINAPPETTYVVGPETEPRILYVIGPDPQPPLYAVDLDH